MEVVDKRKSVLHALNVFLTTSIPIYIVRQTDRYIIGYEPKKYREHRLLYKIDKNLLASIQFGIINEVKISMPIDINVREDFRNTIKANDPQWYMKTKNITVRFISTRYNELPQLYGMIFSFEWRHTVKGGLDELQFGIPECPMISNHNTIPDICYKRVSSQVSGGGTHGLRTYLILAKEHGEYRIADWLKVTNVNKGGHQHSYIYPITVSL